MLFVGLAIGAFAPKAQIIGPIGLTGLIMFLYGIGILYGRQFFEGMTGAAGRKYNLLALVAVVAGLLVALGLGQVFGIKIGHTLGIFAGSMTSTATLQAALDVMKQQRAVDRLLGRLSVRRDRPDPVHLFHDAAGASRNSRRRRSASTWARSRSATTYAGRTLDDSARTCPTACR